MIMPKNKIQRIILIQPIIKVGKSLRIQKSPTGMQCISAYLKAHGFETKMFHEEESEIFYQDVLSYSPDLIGFSAFTVNFPLAKGIAERLKKTLPSIPFVLGGWHASGVVQSFLRGYEDWSLREVLCQDSPFDYIVSGEGEKIIVKLLHVLNKSIHIPWNQLRKIEGLGYLDENNKIVVSHGKRINDLNSLPNPDWDWLDINKYRDQRNTDRIDLSIHAQRGCRFRCTFCQTPSLYKNSVKRVLPERVVNYIEYLINNFNPTDITFTDEDFMSNPSWVKEVCQLIIQRGINKKVTYGSFGSLNDIIKFEKQGVLKLMSKAGWTNYFAGIESLNTQTLYSYNRPMSQNDIEHIDSYLKNIQKAIEISRKRNLLLFGDYIIGYFDESEDQLKSGFKNLLLLRNMLYVYLPIFTPFPGTPLWAIANKNNKLKKNRGKIDWSIYDCSHQVHKLSYNAIKLRDSIEQKYFTSENYYNDMIEHIKRHPHYLVNWYLPLFYKLKKDHISATVFDSIITRLEELQRTSQLR